MSNTILNIRPLGFPWHTADPFLFCVHHLDFYPEGNEAMGPQAALSGRNLGQDFTIKDGWRMYHGQVVPGFPSHPHRGFETITLARQGYIDHSDSLGATARFGQGDVQWMTAGAGIQHSEMFPLVDRSGPNTCELFQIWLNLPAQDKMVAPYFTMMWAPTIPRHTEPGVEVVTVSGALDVSKAPAPPPNSWASRSEAEVAIWTIRLDAGAKWTVPPASEGVNRTLYFFEGASLRLAGKKLAPGVGVQVRADVPVELVNGGEPAQLLMLQGRPIGEAVAHYGPFVMNTQQELQQAFDDYRRTRFGGWPWASNDPVHDRKEGRFAVHADGRKERPPTV